MRLRLLIGLVSVVALSVGCSTATEEDLGSEEGELVQFPASVFASAPTLAYGSTSGVIAYTRAIGWGVVKFNGTAGDEFVATVAPTTTDRQARAYLVEKRGTQYVAILSGTQSLDGIVRAKLAATQEYFIVFKENSRRNASFTVKLDRAGALPAGCAGSPLLDPELIARTPQSQAPAVALSGLWESKVRRCNVATGCTDPIVRKVDNTTTTLGRGPDAKWSMSIGGGSTLHDGATGELTGTVSVSADDGRVVSVPVKGSATSGCVSFSGRQNYELDALTYYQVEASYVAATPPVAARTAYPAVPPATECDGQATIPDEEVLARFPRGAASVVLGGGTLNEDTQYCNPLTGCRPWARASVNWYMTATALVLTRDTIGVQITSQSLGRTLNTATLNDGAFTANGYDVMRGTNALLSIDGTVSDTHLQMKEPAVKVLGDIKSRRYVCIPIISHP